MTNIEHCKACVLGGLYEPKHHVLSFSWPMESFKAGKYVCKWWGHVHLKMDMATCLRIRKGHPNSRSIVQTTHFFGSENPNVIVLQQRQ